MTTEQEKAWVAVSDAAKKAWVAVSDAANKAGWSDDWFSEDESNPASDMTWVEYICYRISLTKKD